MQDEQIVALYWDRKEDAICQTQQKYGAYLSKIAYNILADFEDSEECVNDTYLKAWNSMPTHRPSVLSTYLGKIARQLSIDVYRNEGAYEVYVNPNEPDVILVSTQWHTAPVGENGEKDHSGFNVYIRYNCPLA